MRTSASTQRGTSPRAVQGTRGWIRKDIEPLIGRRYGQLEILSRAARRPDGNLRVSCRCRCWNVCEPRLADVLKGKTTSCGCIGKQRFKEYWDRKARKLPAWLCRSIFIERRKRGAMGTAKASIKFQIAGELVDAAYRVHGARLIEQERRRWQRLPQKAPVKRPHVLEAHYITWIRNHRGLGLPNVPIGCAIENVAEVCPWHLR